MKIVFFSLDKNKQERFIRVFGTSEELVFVDEILNESSAEKGKDAELICLFVGSTVNKKVIDAMRNLKFIVTRSTGYNHIDVAYAKEKGIEVANVPGYGSATVAEFAFAFILNLSRRMYLSLNYVKSTLDFHYNPSMEGFDLEGKTLGVVGTGRIGKHAVKMGQGFGMKIIACDIYPDNEFAEANNFSYVPLDVLLSESDIVTLHTPYNKENHHLINKDNVALIKKGSYLVNTARGELVDTEALMWGLKEGIIAGAGLDVLEEESALKKGEKDKLCELNRELMRMPNVLITPHSAFYSVEAVAEILKITADNILGFTQSKPVNLV